MESDGEKRAEIRRQGPDTHILIKRWMESDGEKRAEIWRQGPGTHLLIKRWMESDGEKRAEIWRQGPDTHKLIKHGWKVMVRRGQNMETGTTHSHPNKKVDET